YCIGELVRGFTHTRQQTRRLRILASATAALAILAVLALGSAIYAYRNLVQAEENLEQAIDIESGLVKKTAALSSRFAIPISVTIELLEQVEVGLNALIAKGRDTEKVRHQRALTLLAFGSAYRTLGHSNEWEDRTRQACARFDALQRSVPSKAAYRVDLAH